MSKETHKTEADQGRREFLKTVTAVGGAAAIVASTQAGAAVTEQEEPSKKAQGYRETDHIREYYRSARV